MKINTKSITKCALAISLMCILSPISINIGPIPITFSLFILFIISLYFPKLECAFIVLAYIILGLVGLPVFSGYSSGAGVLFGLTGGYIWSYLITSLFISHFSKLNEEFIYKFLICFLGLLICYTFGTIQYCFLTKNNFYHGLMVCVIPFLIFDIIKIIIAILFYKNILNKYKF